jgi:hypothetical protein
VRKFDKAYILGSISYQELDKIGIPFFEDEKDWRNGTKFWTDCLNVEMWQLIPLKETIEIFKGNMKHPYSKAQINFQIIEEMRARINDGRFKDRKVPA